MRKLFRAFWLIITFPIRSVVNIIHSIHKGLARIAQQVRTFLYDEEEDAPLTDAFAKVVQNPQGVIYHLNILRQHLFRALAAIALTTALSFVFINQIMTFLALPLEGGLESPHRHRRDRKCRHCHAGCTAFWFCYFISLCSFRNLAFHRSWCQSQNSIARTCRNTSSHSSFHAGYGVHLFRNATHNITFLIQLYGFKHRPAPIFLFLTL